MEMTPGEVVKIFVEGKCYEGIVLPCPKEDILRIKLKSGYNIGIKKEKIDKIEKIGRIEQRIDEKAHDEKRGEIAILGCGGTIASKVDYRTGAVSPAFTPDDLVHSFPKLREFGSFHTRLLFQVFSEDMNPLIWEEMAKEVYEEIKEGARGVVLMHGTDTMHYSSAALSFAINPTPIPIVLVGAQRSSDRPSSDNEINLLNAVFSAKQNFGDVVICMHSSTEDTTCYLHKGTRARKMHTSRRDAFSSIDIPPLAEVDYKQQKFDVKWKIEPRKENTKVELKAKFHDNVAMVYIHPGIKPKMIEKLSDYDGVVLIGTGLGHIPCNACNSNRCLSILEAVKGLVESGIVVVVAPQTIYGRLNLNVYSTGRMMQEVGIIGHGANWTPEVAFVKLCWVLAQEKNQKKAQELMMKNIAGEILEESPLI
jgi:glutamyl-tRNA(Gln) amidotransferase subunit D